MNVFTTDHPLTPQSFWLDPDDHPRLSFVLHVLLLASALTPLVAWRLYIYLTTDIGADNPFPDPCGALLLLTLFSFIISLPCAPPLVLLYRLTARCWKHPPTRPRAPRL
jgi:hypothetical protein